MNHTDNIESALQNVSALLSESDAENAILFDKLSSQPKTRERIALIAGQYQVLAKLAGHEWSSEDYSLFATVLVTLLIVDDVFDGEIPHNLNESERRLLLGEHETESLGNGGIGTGFSWLVETALSSLGAISTENKDRSSIFVSTLLSTTRRLLVGSHPTPQSGERASTEFDSLMINALVGQEPFLNRDTLTDAQSLREVYEYKDATNNPYIALLVFAAGNHLLHHEHATSITRLLQSIHMGVQFVDDILDRKEDRGKQPNFFNALMSDIRGRFQRSPLRSTAQKI